MGLLLALTAVLPVSLVLHSPPPAEAASTPQVILYGDSLSAQAESYFNFFAGLGGSSIVDHVFPGTAPCNWLSQMLSDAASGTVTVAVLQFSGNAFGCMNYTAGTQAYYDAYEQQVTEAAQAFSKAGAHVFLIGYPVSYGAVQQAVTSYDHLNEIYAAIANSVSNVTFVNAEEAVESNGDFAWTLPCLSFESYCGPGGQNIVRAADGGHFCPQNPDSVACAAWDSGALRYGMAMANAVNQFVTSGQAPTYEGDPLPPPGVAPTVAPGQINPYLDTHDALTLVAPLTSGQQLLSLDGRYAATLQPSGNLVVTGPQGALWDSNTGGRGANELLVGTDGNVSLDGPGGPVWSTDTSGTPGNYLAMQEDGRLVLWGATGPLWSTPGPDLLGLQVVGMAATPTGQGYWLATSDGQVLSFGDASHYGSLSGFRLDAPIIGIAATPDGHGFWLLGQDGGVFAFGDARFYGSTGGVHLVRPVVGMASSPDGHGYWLVASDGGMFAFGDARFLGSTASMRLARPIVGMTSTGDDGGYFLVASDGGLFAFGDARFAGSMAGHILASPVVGMAFDPATQGYWELAADGGIFSFKAPFLGSTGATPTAQPVIGMTVSGDGLGYRLVTAGGWVGDFGDAAYANDPS